MTLTLAFHSSNFRQIGRVNKMQQMIHISVTAARLYQKLNMKRFAIRKKSSGTIYRWHEGHPACKKWGIVEVGTG